MIVYFGGQRSGAQHKRGKQTLDTSQWKKKRIEPESNQVPRSNI